jgi:hypothetical protein
MKEEPDIKSKAFLVVVCLLITLLTTGCFQDVQTEQPTTTTATPMRPTSTATSTYTVRTQTESPKVTSTQTATPTNTHLPTIGLKPTLSVRQVEQVLDLLQDETCQLPCYLGIIPGQTKFNDANQKLKSMGATIYGELELPYEDEIMNAYYFTLDVDITSESVGHNVKLYVYEEIVFRMEVDISGPLSKLFYEYWSRYSITTIMENNGLPDAVYISSKQRAGNNVWFLFQESGFFMGNKGIDREDNLACPGFRRDITRSIYMLLFDPSYHEALSASSELDYISMFSFQDGLWQNDTDNIVPIELILGVELDQFHEKMLADPEKCFERLFVEQ